MLRFVPVFLLSFVCCFVWVESLECGIAEQMGEEALQSALLKCTAGKADETKENTDKSSEEDSEEAAKSYSASRGVVSSRIRRSKVAKRDTNSSLVHDHGEAKEEQSGASMDNKCVLQCIFNELGMVDVNGFPEHNLVAAALLNNAKGRELRDFIQDTTDACFQLMQQGEKMDNCDYAIHLISCLAEKGRSNCADWQIMKIPLHS